MNQQSVKFSIRWKLLSIMTCLMICVLLVSTWLQIVNQKQLYGRELSLLIHLTKEKLVSRGTIISGNLVREVQNGLATVNLSQISETLKKTVDEDQGLSYAILMDSSGRAYIHTLAPEKELDILTDIADQYAIQQQQPVNYEHTEYGIHVIEFIVPIQISTQPWGVLRLGFSLDVLNKETQRFQENYAIKIKEMIWHSIYVAIIFIAISSIIILILSDRLSRPLRRLTHAASKLAAGDFSVAENLNDLSKDEIGVLSTTFKEMSNDLKISYHELQNYNLKLEYNVKERTAELAEARDEAIKANQSKSDFLSMISHEIRTPMNAIIGLTQLALKTDLTERQFDYLSKVKASSDALLTIINDLLDVSKIEAGQLGIEVVNFNLDSVLTNLKSMAGVKADEKKLNLQFSIADDVPLILRGDPLRLGQVLLNLVTNAIKFTESGGVIVQVSLDEKQLSDSQKVCLKFSVKDTGIGLTEQQIDGLFEPFVQADTSTTRLYGGTGLGLTICKKLVELMDGEIMVVSEQGIGSDFIFTITVQRDDSAELFAPGYDKDTGEGVTAQRASGCRILVVDDHEINQQVAKGILEEEGFEVAIANNGVAALDKVHDHFFDAVLMDLQMPKMDGYEATRIIRSEPRFSKLPIIALTADARQDKTVKLKENGFDACITKPIDMEQLIEILAECIDKHSSCSKSPASVFSDKRNVIVNIDSKAGLNYKQGIKQVSGNKHLYHKLLSEFEQQFSHAVEKISSKILSADLEQAEQLIHSLKGVASNIAAVELAEKLGELESRLKIPNEDFSNLLAQCERALECVLSEIKKLHIGCQDETENRQVNSDYKKACKNLVILIELLKDSRLDADLYFDAFKAALEGVDFVDEVKQLGQYIDQFDFDSALTISTALLAKLPVDIEYQQQVIIDKNNTPCILIVDDIPLNIKVLVQALRDNYVIKIAKNGDKVESITKMLPQPDLILLDIEMPGMNGYEVCAKLKTNVLTEKIPVIFITGRTEVIDEKIGLEMGAVDYIAKPFNASVVQARVKTHVELKRQTDMLAKMATQDSLTGIANRRYFDEYIEQEWLRARRSKTFLSIIFIDVDFFKHFNDFFGHNVGDQCLKIVATAIKQCLKRQSDFVARYGGEEFVVVLPDTDITASAQLAERIRSTVQALKLPHTPAKGFTSVTLSLGVSSIIPDRKSNVAALVGAADRALYQAKCGGRNQVKELQLTD